MKFVWYLTFNKTKKGMMMHHRLYKGKIMARLLLRKTSVPCRTKYFGFNISYWNCWLEQLYDLIMPAALANELLFFNVTYQSKVSPLDSVWWLEGAASSSSGNIQLYLVTGNQQDICELYTKTLNLYLL